VRHRDAHNLLSTLVILIALGLCATAQAQQLSLSKRCGDPQTRELLREELALRPVETRGWALAWERAEGHCRLEISDYSPALWLPLASNATPDEIRAAVVRAAWFMSTHDPRPTPQEPARVAEQDPEQAPEPAPVPSDPSLEGWNMRIQLGVQHLPNKASTEDATFLDGWLWMTHDGALGAGVGVQTQTGTLVARLDRGQEEEAIARLDYLALRTGLAWSPHLNKTWRLQLRGEAGLGLIHYALLEDKEKSEPEDSARLEAALVLGVLYRWSEDIHLEGGLSWRQSLTRLSDGPTPDKESSLYGLGLAFSLLWTL
jgi:hypothetical protein